jgi:hypothetical protein
VRPTSCLCTGCNGSGRVALLLFVLRDSPVRVARRACLCRHATAAGRLSRAVCGAVGNLGQQHGRYRQAMTDEDDDDEFEPLLVFPDPVHIKAHDPDVGGPSVVRLFFRPGPTAIGPVAGFRMCS